MKRLIILPITIFSAITIFQEAVFCASGKEFTTRYTTIHYNEDKDMDDFIWRLGGQKLEFSHDRALASSRVDRIIDRVRNVLDIQPAKFTVDIYLYRGPLESGQPAFFEYKTRSIHISIENVTDGVFAHEVAHAIINFNFGPALPSKVQEILTQYADKYLWSDY
ncbi:MAG: hypothetical protein KBB52_01790 [Candidatus Omnitrophica bacterium]|nr:hypothetical protein [Candidatus Omnitrophota bacterium]